MKKVTGIAVTATLVLVFFGCINNGDTHEHTFAETYSYNENYHWFAATCEHTEEVKDKASHKFGNWAVITEATAEKPALGMGIKQSPMLIWCDSSAEGYNKNIEDLIGYIDEGYTDGRDGWEILKTACSDAEEYPKLYPAWQYCLDYAENNGLTGVLAEGWYLPTMDELNTIYQNKEAIEASLEKVGGDHSCDGFNWSCCQFEFNTSEVRDLSLNNSVTSSSDKNLSADNLYVCSVKVFE